MRFLVGLFIAAVTFTAAVLVVFQLRALTGIPLTAPQTLTVPTVPISAPKDQRLVWTVDYVLDARSKPEFTSWNRFADGHVKATLDIMRSKEEEPGLAFVYQYHVYPDRIWIKIYDYSSGYLTVYVIADNDLDGKPDYTKVATFHRAGEKLHEPRMSSESFKYKFDEAILLINRFKV